MQILSKETPDLTVQLKVCVQCVKSNEFMYENTESCHNC